MTPEQIKELLLLTTPSSKTVKKKSTKETIINMMYDWEGYGKNTTFHNNWTCNK
jgi:hypothetical protein